MFSLIPFDYNKRLHDPTQQVLLKTINPYKEELLRKVKKVYSLVLGLYAFTFNKSHNVQLLSQFKDSLNTLHKFLGTF